MSNTELKLPTAIKESLLQARLHCTQSNEMTSMIAEGEDKMSNKINIWKFHETYVEAVEAKVVASLNLGIVQAILDCGDEYVALGAYMSNGESLAFPGQNAEHPYLPDTIDEYVRELARDICSTVTISALDLIDEVEGWLWEINETLK